MPGPGLPVSPPEAMADVPGVCEVPLTRAVVQYREGQDRSATPPGGKDLGLALVLDGRFPSRARSVDLGSGRIRLLDLSTELVVVDWVYPPTLDHVLALVAREGVQGGGGSDAGALPVYCRQVARSLVERAGFTPLVRPTLLRLAFQDIAEDLDPHEGAAIRVLMGPGRVARMHLDVDHLRLVARTSTSDRDAVLEGAFLEAFPTFELRRTLPEGPEGLTSYLVLLPVPGSFRELRAMMDRVRKGVTRLMGRFEPERLRAMEAQLAAFGARDSLGRLRLRDARGGSEPVGRGVPAHGAEPVH